MVGGQLIDCALESNRTRDTRVPGDAVLVLPLFQDTDAAARTTVSSFG